MRSSFPYAYKNGPPSFISGREARPCACVRIMPPRTAYYRPRSPISHLPAASRGRARAHCTSDSCTMGRWQEATGPRLRGSGLGWSHLAGVVCRGVRHGSRCLVLVARTPLDVARYTRLRGVSSRAPPRLARRGYVRTLIACGAIENPSGLGALSHGHQLAWSCSLQGRAGAVEAKGGVMGELAQRDAAPEGVWPTVTV